MVPLPRTRRAALVGASLLAPVAVVYGCGGSPWNGGTTTGTPGSSSSSSGGTGGGCGAACPDGSPGDAAQRFACFGVDEPLAPNPCPSVAGGSGQVSFCYRAGWAGITTVDVFGTFGQANDWTAPFLTLTNDGTGTFTGTAKIPDGTYPYMFRIQGGADGQTFKNQYLLDQRAQAFVDTPPGSPTYNPNATVPRACSAVTVPQVAAPTYMLVGHVHHDGQGQGCYLVKLEVGELVVGGAAKREHNTANFAETAADGSFTFEVAGGLTGAAVEFPFNLVEADGGYPDPLAYQAAAYAAPAMFTVAGDTTLDPIDMAYHDYAQMTPVGQGGTLPVTFHYTVIAGSKQAGLAADKTRIPGNDPGFLSPLSTMTSYTWDGTFGGNNPNDKAMPGVQYYWGTFQKMSQTTDGGTAWTVESMLLPITFQ